MHISLGQNDYVEEGLCWPGEVWDRELQMCTGIPEEEMLPTAGGRAIVRPPPGSERTPYGTAVPGAPQTAGQLLYLNRWLLIGGAVMLMVAVMTRRS